MASNNRGSGSQGGGKSGKGKNAQAAERRAKVEEMMRAQAKSRRRSQLGFGALLVVVVLVLGGLVAFGLTREHKGAAVDTASAAVVKDVTTVPAASFDTVGTGTSGVNPPQKIDGDKLTSDGKPEVLYVGAEYCPYCAAERWAVVTALARFGTFSGLGATESSSTDVFPSTNTLSFHGATYKSDYVTLKAYETEDTDGNALDKLDDADQAVFTKYDAPPLTTANSAGSIPFIDFAGAYAVSGASFTPGVLANKTHAEIAQAITDPSSTIGKNVLTAANYFTAVICEQTGGKPSDVCSTSAVTAATAKLPTQVVGSAGDPSSTGNQGSSQQ